jgi:hypothetical protein
MIDDRAEPGGSILELANRPPEEWEHHRPVQIPFGLFGVDRIDWRAAAIATPKPLRMQDIIDGFIRMSRERR